MKNDSKLRVNAFLMILINLIYIILSEKLNNNKRNLNNRYNIKIKISNDNYIDDNDDFDDIDVIEDVDIISLGCLFYFNEVPDFVYLNGYRIYLDNKCLKIVNNNLENENTLIIEWNSKIKDISHFFYFARKNVLEIDFSEFDASKITSMSQLFFGCTKLKSIQFGKIDTSSLIYMDYMFYGCKSLYSIDLSNFNTKNVEKMNDMFNGCSSLTSLDLTNFDTSNVFSMDYMFYGCSSLTSLNISNFNTSQLYTMYNFFYGLESIKELELSSLDTSEVIFMDFFLGECKSLTSIRINLTLTNAYSLKGFFCNCSSLMSIEFSQFDTSSVVDMSYMFYGLKSFTSLDLSTFNTSNVQYMQYMFAESSSLISINFTGFDISKTFYMDFMFYRCFSLVSLDLSSFNFNQVDMNDFFHHCHSLTSIKFSSHYLLPNSVENMFKDCFSLLSIDFSSFDFGIIENMQSFFSGCTKLTSIDLSSFDTFSVDNMKYMFYGCSSLTEIDIEWITPSVLDINSMFYDCFSLISLDLAMFDTSFVTNMKGLFYNCAKLTSIDLNHFKTNEVTDMQSMFYGCESLKSLNISSFVTSNVINMKSMFYNCKKLTSLDLSNFNTENVTNMESMFSGCTNLIYINFYNFNDKSLEVVKKFFLGIRDNVLICMKKELNKTKINLELSRLKCPIINCSNNWEIYIKKIIYSNNICIDDCGTYDKYEYNYFCYDECPEGTHSSNNNKFLCEKNVEKCIKKYPFLWTENNTCADRCSSKDFFNQKCTLNDNSIENKLIIINRIKKDIENGIMDGLISKYFTKNKDIIIKNNETIYQISSTWNQNNKQYNNISSIKLDQCENILKEQYSISTDESLIIFKIEEDIKELLIPLIEYEIFNLKTKEKLDLNYCKNENVYIEIYIPASINENIIFKYDPKNSYYNDICNTFTTEYGTDMTIYDRKLEYNNNNLFLCPANCEYINYNADNKKVLCQCKPQNGISLDKNKMINHFKIFNYTTNLNVLKCFEFFSKKGLMKNIANYIISLIILLNIILGIYFYLKEYNIFIKEIFDVADFAKKTNELNLKKNNNKTNNSFSTKKEKDNINDINIDNKTVKEKDNMEMSEQIYYNDYEINILSFEKALEIDKRTYCEFYLSLIKTYHIVLFTFCSNKDFNPRIIKLCLFFFIIALYMFIITLFFNDALMHQIYSNKGKFNFNIILPPIIYSIIICKIIIIIIKYLSMTQRNILEIQYENDPNILNFKIFNVTKCIKKKFICFFIFNYILLFFFWYYLSCFCFVYNNTQLYLLKAVIITYAISLIYPFIISLLPGLFRIPALKSPGKCYYQASKLFHFL